MQDEESGTERSVVVDADDGIRQDTTADSLAKLSPSFKMDGRSTAGNSSQVSDGAAAVLLMRRSVARKLGVRPLARVLSYAVVGVPPDIMGVGPAVAIPEALRKAGLSTAHVDVCELNEAFASQALYCIQNLGLDPARVNPNGGAIALGHPLGCTGARQVTDRLTFAVAVCPFSHSRGWSRRSPRSFQSSAGAAASTVWSLCASAQAWGLPVCLRSSSRAGVHQGECLCTGENELWKNRHRQLDATCRQADLGLGTADLLVDDLHLHSPARVSAQQQHGMSTPQRTSRCSSERFWFSCISALPARSAPLPASAPRTCSLRRCVSAVSSLFFFARSMSTEPAP